MAENWGGKKKFRFLVKIHFSLIFFAKNLFHIIKSLNFAAKFIGRVGFYRPWVSASLSHISCKALLLSVCYAGLINDLQKRNK